MIASVKSAIEEFCDVFKLEINTIEYGPYAYGHDYCIVLYPQYGEISPINEEDGHEYWELYAYENDEGEVMVSDEYLIDYNVPNSVDGFMLFEDYLDYVIGMFVDDGWVYENNTWS
jgi:hypothetical protein